MFKFNEDNNKVEYVNDKGEVLAKANFAILDKHMFKEFVDWLVAREIADIREFDCSEDCSDETILSDFSENFEELHALNGVISDKDKIVYIDYIENVSSVKGAGSEIVNSFMNLCGNVLIFPVEDARPHWEKCGFKYVYRDEYMLLQ